MKTLHNSNDSLTPNVSELLDVANDHVAGCEIGMVGTRCDFTDMLFIVRMHI